jgi:dihydroorotase
MKSSILLRNVLLWTDTVFDNNHDDNPIKKVDLRIVDGKITELGPKLKPHSNTHEVTEEQFECAGCTVFPGLIDIHTHLRDFGESGSEDISSGTLAAAAGGYTTLLTMANTMPPIDGLFVLNSYLKRIAEAAVIKVIPAAAVTKQLAGLELTNMVELAEAGAGAFSDDGRPITNLAVLRRALEYAKLSGKILISHPEDRDLSSNGSMNESARSTWLGLVGIPTASEAACVAREIEVVRYTGGRLHFAHISTAASVNLIRHAKEDGLPVTADVTPHHLILTDEDIASYDASKKMNPPLRSQHDQEMLIAGLKDGTLDAIATDHAPHSISSKSRLFDQCSCGVIGLETAFSLCYERLVEPGHLSISELVQVLSTKPAAILCINEPNLKVGEQANLTVINLSEKWKYNVNSGFSKGKNSPFDGRTLTGRVMLTIADGKLAYCSEKQSLVTASGR